MKVSAFYRTSFYFQGKKFIFRPGQWIEICFDDVDENESERERFLAFMEQACRERAPLVFRTVEATGYRLWALLSEQRYPLPWTVSNPPPCSLYFYTPPPEGAPYIYFDFRFL